ncbi:MAG: diaminopimelate decarboxylase [Alphaproteobacteria bacterium]|nr:diaminopimelate decarboxylase [Alphaproteobacteria bacterium SS10]
MTAPNATAAVTDGAFQPLAPGFDAAGTLGYQNGVLTIDGVSAAELADQHGTPAYILSQRAVERAYGELSDALNAAMDRGQDGPPRKRRICYAVKANANHALLTALARKGAGADVVSIGEAKLALKAGFKAADIVFSGVGKHPNEITEAIQLGIGQINAESVEEIAVIERCAAAIDGQATVALRVNPEVDARTHAKISTGKKGDKFGIPIDEIISAYHHLAAQSHLKAGGLAVHIGSQITDPEPFRQAFKKIADLVTEIRSAGVELDHLDLGGGLGIRYKDETPIEPAGWAAAIADIALPLGCDVTVEPGRYIAGPAGLLLAEVLYVKTAADRTIIILDASMSELIRPSLYEAWHEIIPVKEPAPGVALEPVDLVGPVCESGDTFAQARKMPPLAVGDRVAFLTAGAYASVMASTYNARPLPPEIVVAEGKHHAVRPRLDFSELAKAQTLPDWL